MTLINKAEAHDDDLIRRGDARDVVYRIQHGYSDVPENWLDAIDALPARGVGVKDFDVEIVRGNTGGNLSLYFNDHRVAGSKPWGGGTTIHSFRVQGDEVKSSGIFATIRNFQTVPAVKECLTTAALAPTDAAHVNETPKSEHDAGNVLTDAALIARLREIQGQAGLFASTAADRIEQLVKDKRWIIEERDRTFALMLARAEAAEAELEKLRVAATWAMNHVSTLPMDEATQSEFMRHRAALITEEGK